MFTYKIKQSNTNDKDYLITFSYTNDDSFYYARVMTSTNFKKVKRFGDSVIKHLNGLLELDILILDLERL